MKATDLRSWLWFLTAILMVPNAYGQGETILGAYFMNGNTDTFSSRIYLWNPSDSPGEVTVRAFTLPLTSGMTQELTTEPLALGTLGAKSAFNIKLAEDILTPIGVSVPYTADGGNLTVELTIGVAGVQGVAQVFSGEFAFGTYPLQVISATGTNTATGNGALQNNTTGTDNTATGFQALLNNTTGFENTATGTQALVSNTTGFRNTATGFQALMNNTIGTHNTATGSRTLLNNSTGNSNTATGRRTLTNNTTGDFNTATGFQALLNNTTGFENTATGTQALVSNTTGFRNTAVGLSALLSNTSGSDNTAVGLSALSSNTSGSDNTAMGQNALSSNTTGNSNIATGDQALANNTTGLRNAAIGVFALGNNTTGDFNTAIGVFALSNNTTGGSNTAIGRDANVSTGNLTNATAIGFDARVDANNKVRIGNSSVTVIEGQVAFSFPSDRNLKENFQPVDGEEVLEKIREIPVQSWNYIGHDPKEFRHYGPVAQDFFAAFGHDDIGTVGTPTTINSGDMQGILMIAVQGLERLVAEQREDIERLNARLEEMENTGYGNNVLSDNNGGLNRTGDKISLVDSSGVVRNTFAYDNSVEGTRIPTGH